MRTITLTDVPKGTRVALFEDFPENTSVNMEKHRQIFNNAVDTGTISIDFDARYAFLRARCQNRDTEATLQAYKDAADKTGKWVPTAFPFIRKITHFVRPTESYENLTYERRILPDEVDDIEVSFKDIIPKD